MRLLNLPAWRTVFALLFGFSLLLAAVVLQAEEKPAPKEAGEPASAKKKKDEGPKYIRLTRDAEDVPTALQTNIIHFTKPAEDPSQPPIRIDLIGAVHVGEKSYYQDLNKRFAEYEVVLYELVAPAGTKIPKDGKREGVPHPVSGLQMGMKSMLALEFQLEQVDYTKDNFVHADMSPEEFDKSMKDRGESFAQMFLRMMGQGIAQQQQKKEGSSDLDLLLALFSKDRSRQLKISMARQFEDMEGQMAVLEGEEGSTIITERNRKAFEVLDKELKAGKKHIAIFYGAGHLSDMEKRLINDFGCQRGEEEWITAWKLD